VVVHFEGNSKVHPVTCHEGTEEEMGNGCALALGTLGIRGWEGSRTGPEMGGKSRPHWNLIPGPSSL